MKRIILITTAVVLLLTACAPQTPSSSPENTSSVLEVVASIAAGDSQSEQTVSGSIKDASSEDALPPAEDGSILFTVPLLDENEMQTGEVMRFSCELPDEWKAEDTTVFADSSILAQWIGVYPSNSNIRQQVATKHAQAERTEEVTVGGISGQYYHMQSEFNEGGMTGIKNELFYYLEVGDSLVCIAFYPRMGVGGISSQREEWEACLVTLRRVAADSSLCADFSLKADAVGAQPMHIGDTLGDWTLSDLQISYDKEKKIQMLEALFAGNVTLKGTISRSGLVEDGYDFTVSEQDEEKMPHYVASEMTPKDTTMFMLNFPEEIAATLNLSQDEQKKCEMTISTYRFIFAYMTAPASATVIELKI